MFDPDLIARLAAELDQSERSRVQVEHFSRRFPGMSIAEGSDIPATRFIAPRVEVELAFASVPTTGRWARSRFVSSGRAPAHRCRTDNIWRLK